MAGADDDIEKLLREVEGVLGGGKPASGSAPERSAQRQPDRAEGSSAGPVDRLRAGLPVAVAVGAVSGAVIGLTFTVLPFVDGLSGALGAFATGMAVSLAGRLRRR